MTLISVHGVRVARRRQCNLTMKQLIDDLVSLGISAADSYVQEELFSEAECLRKQPCRILIFYFDDDRLAE